MKRRWIVWTLLAFCGTASYAQQGGSISGTLIDAETRRALQGANVQLENTRRGSSTDRDGRFSIVDIDPGVYRLRLSYVGYETLFIPVIVTSAEHLTVDTALVPTPIIGRPITVTATRGLERKTPAAFTNLEQLEILERYTTQDIPVLLSELPSSTYYSESGNGIGYTYLNIRGFDPRRIAVMVNGIPQNDPEDHNVYWLDFPDIAGSLENVQVQRGAGSAFYGPPAIGGSVNLVTSDFGRKRSLEVSAGVGSFNTRRYAVSFNSGLVDDRYAFHARLGKILSDGYRERSWTDFNSYFFGAIRYDENMTTQLNFYGGPVADHLAYYGIPKSAVRDRIARRENPIARPEELENFSQPHYELFHEWRLNPALTLNNTFFFVSGDGFFDYDGSWAPYSYYRIGPAWGIPVAGDPDTLYPPGGLIRAWVSNRQFGWLPRLTIRQAAGELIIGAELRVHRSDHWGRLQWAEEIPAGVPNDYHYYEYNGAKDILSFYANESFAPAPSVELEGSIQYIFNRYRLYNEKFLGNDFTVPYHFINPRLGVNYNVDDHWNMYISGAYTTREPRLNNLYNAGEASTPFSWGPVVPQFRQTASGAYDFNDPLVKPESLFDLEIGSGYRQERTRASVNVYWMEFLNEIVNSGQVDRFGQPITGNAHRTRHIGLEFTGGFDIQEGLSVSGNATLSRNRIVRHTDYSGGSPVPLDGNPIAGFPDFLANIRCTYARGPVTFSWTARYVGRQYTDNFKTEEHSVDPSFVCNAALTWKIRSQAANVGLEAKMQVNNVFDVLYAAYGEGDQFFVGAERNVFFQLVVAL